jgi:hypothetical protein
LVLQFGGGIQYQQAAQDSQQTFAAQNAAASFAAAQAAAAQVTVAMYVTSHLPLPFFIVYMASCI